MAREVMKYEDTFINGATYVMSLFDIIAKNTGEYDIRIIKYIAREYLKNKIKDTYSLSAIICDMKDRIKKERTER